MREDRLSMRQFLAVLWGGILGAAPELLPGEGAGAGLLSLGSAAVLFLGLILAGLLYEPLIGSRGLAGAVRSALGERLGKAVLLLYIVWGEVLLTSHLLTAARRLAEGGERDGGAWFFLTVLSGMTLWMSAGRLDALGRAAQLMVRAMWVTAAGVLLLAALRASGVNLVSWAQSTGNSGLNAVRSGISAMGSVLLCSFLPVRETVRSGKRLWRGAALLWSLGLGAWCLVILGSFGPEFTGSMTRPFFQLAKTVGVTGGFQRLESVVTAIWIFGDLLLLAGTLWAMTRIGTELTGRLRREQLGTILLLPALAAAYLLSSGGRETAQTAGSLLPAGTIFMGYLLPLAVLLCRRPAGKRRGGQTEHILWFWE